MTVTLNRDAGKVFFEGLENANIGSPPHTNSVMAARSYAFQAAGADISYEYLMGVSGAAFRLQMYQPEWCPSAPHAACGFRCCDVAQAAVPFDITGFEPKADDVEGVEKARREIVASIDRGIPVICYSEEDSLVVGYEDGGKVLLVRAYVAGKPGYKPLNKWPWGFGIIKRKAEMPDPGKTILRSLEIAKELAHSKNYYEGHYASGFAAYEIWIAGLNDDKRFENKTPKDLPILANAHCYSCLVDARAAAAIYLRGVAGKFPADAQAHLLKAADLYDREQRDVLSKKCPTDIAPYPWSLKKGQSWTSAMRHEQAAILKEAFELDKQAVAEIESALAAGGMKP